MNLPFVADLDLRESTPPDLPDDRPVHGLLWWGDHVLGQATLAPGVHRWEDLRREFTGRLQTRVTALESLRAEPPPDSAEPRHITVVVCTRERPDLLAGCLEAVHALDPAPAEVVVVDNAPRTQRTADLAERWGARRVVEPRPGLSHARNAGWRAVRTPIVAFTDDDARPHRRWIAALSQGFVTASVGCVTGLVAAAELMTPAQRLFEGNGGMGKGFDARLFSADTVGLQGWLVGVGANMAFRTVALEEIGGFDPHLGSGTVTRGGEDLDIFVRLLAGGGAAMYAPDAVVRHVHRRDLPSLVRQYRDNGFAYAALLRKYEQSGGVLSTAAVRERTRWRRQRHVRSLLGSVRRREGARFLEIICEISGSLGVAAAYGETRALAENRSVLGGSRAH
ncbi:glycosyltransferase [Geodermatophilus sp. SYSU D00691]